MLPCPANQADEYPTRQLALVGPLLSPLNGTAAALPARYFGPEESLVEEGQAPLASTTHWVVADAATRQGLALVAAALQHRSTTGRLALLLNSAAAAAGQPLTPVERLVAAVGSGLLQPGAWRRGRLAGCPAPRLLANQAALLAASLLTACPVLPSPCCPRRLQTSRTWLISWTACCASQAPRASSPCSAWTS